MGHSSFFLSSMPLKFIKHKLRGYNEKENKSKKDRYFSIHVR
jgi:hypothetical protein